MSGGMVQVPRFAVVGHPNKGKSSIVATLAQDDSVYIDRVSGSTKTSRVYPMQVDGEVLYELVDTPGFQRARAALSWLNDYCQDVSQRYAAVKTFCEAHEHEPRFHNECELLNPLLEGAGIIYVVDGSRPYGPEYEAEMEILRWTGRPSLALINPIDSDDYVAEWQSALGQYFKTVRVFDAHRVEFVKRVGLLQVFGQLDEQWQAQLSRAVEILKSERERQHFRAAEIISMMISDLIQHRESQNIPEGVPSDTIEQLLAKKYETALRGGEQRARKRVEEIFAYYQLQRSEAKLEVNVRDLLDQESWYLFGLSKTQLLTAAAGAGASAGAIVDIGLGGHSLLLGSVLGGLAGGVGAWSFSDRIAKFHIKGLPTGGVRIQYGPSVNPNFPFVLLGRALQHHRLLCTRTHADRQALTLQDDNPVLEFSLSERSTLMKLFRDIARGNKLIQQQERLRELIYQQLLKVDGRPN